MKIYVDADACPNVIKEILFKSVERLKVPLMLVANQFVRSPESEYISSMIVSAGLDEADERIVEMLEPGDLVITADIPLVTDIIDKGGHAINPRGELYTLDSIGQRRSMRDFMTELRNTGAEVSGGPPAFSAKDRQNFANQLDRFLTKALRKLNRK